MSPPFIGDMAYLKTGVIYPKPPLKDPFIISYHLVDTNEVNSTALGELSRPVFSRRDTLGIIHQNYK